MIRRWHPAYGLPQTGLPRARQATNRYARNPVADHATRYARRAGVTDEVQRPFWRPFLWWLAVRVLGLAVLLGAAGAVYDVASSDRLMVRAVQVQGNSLVGRQEIEDATAVLGANLFWVNHQDVASRLAQFPAIERVEVEPVLPDTVQVRVVERQPVARWRTTGQTYLVDRDGRVLLALPTDQAICDDETPCMAAAYDNLPIVEQIDGDPVAVGQHVDAHALAASQRLAALLPQYGVQPLAFDWSANTGLEIPTQYGWRVRFDGDRNVEQQLTALVAMRDYLTRTGQSAQVIDVRFGDRPYYQ